MMKQYILLFIFLLPVMSYAQKYSISGKVELYAYSGNPFGVQVYIDNSSKGTISDSEGNYRIENIPEGELTIIFSYVGYKKISKTIFLTADTEINQVLLPEEQDLEEVVIKSDRLIDRSSVSDISLVSDELHTFQGLQEDPLSVIASMPGISKGAGDLFSSSQLYVRGGAPEENLFMMDNVKVYWPWYFGGIKSSFNSETIDKLELLTGGFSAKYGNAMSSVVRVTTRDGDFKDYGGNFSFGFSNLQLCAEGPLIRDTLSALISVRKTYLDLIMGEDSSFPVPSLFDVTYKTSWKINDRHKLSLSGLSSRENIYFFREDPEPGMPGRMNSNGTTHNQSMQLRSMWSGKFYSNISLVHSLTNYDMKIGEKLSMDLTGDNWGIRNDFTYLINENHKFDFGIDFNYSELENNAYQPFNPLETNTEDSTIQYYNLSVNSVEFFSGSYLSYRGRIFDRLSWTIGGRYDFLNFESSSRIHDFSPRISVKYELNEKTGIRAAYGYFHQQPNDESLLNNKELESNQCIHQIVGITHSFNPAIKGWVEVYRKKYNSLVVKDSLGNFSNKGQGFTNGAELFITKQKGSFQGWISYALSYAKRKQSLMDKEYFFEYDKRHMFNVSLSYHAGNCNKTFVPSSFSIQFRYESGTPYTPVIRAEYLGGQWYPVKGELLSGRNPAFHTMSAKINWDIVKKAKFRLASYFEIWNVYNHKNLMGREYTYGTQYENNVLTEEYYSIPFMPGGGFKIIF